MCNFFSFAGLIIYTVGAGAGLGENSRICGAVYSHLWDFTDVSRRIPDDQSTQEKELKRRKRYYIVPYIPSGVFLYLAPLPFCKVYLVINELCYY